MIWGLFTPSNLMERFIATRQRAFQERIWPSLEGPSYDTLPTTISSRAREEFSCERRDEKLP